MACVQVYLLKSNTFAYYSLLTFKTQLLKQKSQSQFMHHVGSVSGGGGGEQSDIKADTAWFSKIVFKMELAAAPCSNRSQVVGPNLTALVVLTQGHRV